MGEGEPRQIAYEVGVVGERDSDAQYQGYGERTMKAREFAELKMKEVVEEKQAEIREKIEQKKNLLESATDEKKAELRWDISELEKESRRVGSMTLLEFVGDRIRDVEEGKYKDKFEQGERTSSDSEVKDEGEQRVQVDEKERQELEGVKEELENSASYQEIEDLKKNLEERKREYGRKLFDNETQKRSKEEEVRELEKEIQGFEKDLGKFSKDIETLKSTGSAMMKDFLGANSDSYVENSRQKIEDLERKREELEKEIGEFDREKEALVERMADLAGTLRKTMALKASKVVDSHNNLIEFEAQSAESRGEKAKAAKLREQKWNTYEEAKAGLKEQYEGLLDAQEESGENQRDEVGKALKLFESLEGRYNEFKEKEGKDGGVDSGKKDETGGAESSWLDEGMKTAEGKDKGAEFDIGEMSLDEATKWRLDSIDNDEMKMAKEILGSGMGSGKEVAENSEDDNEEAVNELYEELVENGERKEVAKNVGGKMGKVRNKVVATMLTLAIVFGFPTTAFAKTKDTNNVKGDGGKKVEFNIGEGIAEIIKDKPTEEKLEILNEIAGGAFSTESETQEESSGVEPEDFGEEAMRAYSEDLDSTIDHGEGISQYWLLKDGGIQGDTIEEKIDDVQKKVENSYLFSTVHGAVLDVDELGGTSVNDIAEKADEYENGDTDEGNEFRYSVADRIEEEWNENNVSEFAPTSGTFISEMIIGGYVTDSGRDMTLSYREVLDDTTEEGDYLDLSDAYSNEEKENLLELLGVNLTVSDVERMGGKFVERERCGQIGIWLPEGNSVKVDRSDPEKDKVIVTPENPESEIQPEINPETPEETAEIPITPTISPVTPEPEVPVTPETPVTPEIPETPVTPENPKPIQQKDAENEIRLDEKFEEENAADSGGARTEKTSSEEVEKKQPRTEAPGIPEWEQPGQNRGNGAVGEPTSTGNYTEEQAEQAQVKQNEANRRADEIENAQKISEEEFGNMVDNLNAEAAKKAQERNV